MDSKYKRYVQCSVTCFLYFGDEYLLLKRAENKRTDPGRLNGVGGRVEPGENFLTAAIRETKEETGYVVEPLDIKLSALVRTEGGYKEDWVVAFFKIKVNKKEFPIGNKTDDGELIWIHKDKVLDSEYEVVDDLNYLFKDIVEEKNIVFFTGSLDSDQNILQSSIGKIK